MLLGLVLQGLMPNGFPLVTKSATGGGTGTVEQITEIHASGPVRINELMTSNGGVLTDENGATPDWIEIMNVSNGTVNLSGYSLSRSASSGSVFTFPDYELKAGECAIVYADGHAATEGESQFHAPFRLSSAGDVLMLFNSAKVAVDTVNIPAIARNHSYARQSVDQWAETSQCTPGLPNTEESYRSLTTVTQASTLRIAEVMSSNTTVYPDENGAYHDYICIANTGAEAADLSGWYLTDDISVTRMWRFPSGVVIPAGGTLVVHASSLDRTEDLNHLHTNFSLSSEGETVALSNPNGQPVDILEIPLLKDNQSYPG